MVVLVGLQPPDLVETIVIKHISYYIGVETHHKEGGNGKHINCEPEEALSDVELGEEYQNCQVGDASVKVNSVDHFEDFLELEVRAAYHHVAGGSRYGVLLALGLHKFVLSSSNGYFCLGVHCIGSK